MQSFRIQTSAARMSTSFFDAKAVPRQSHLSLRQTNVHTVRQMYIQLT